MQAYQRDFIKFALARGVLRFGEFTLKSKRQSPYFFNAGLFCDGDAYAQLGVFYANAIQEHFAHDYDVIFGPAYKGITLATAASIGLKTQYQRNVPVSYNRKEAKNHGEGGVIVGASLTGQRVLLIDDVISAGITIREAIALIQNAGGKLTSVIVALDRQEKGLTSERSAIQEVEETFHLKVESIVTLQHIIEYLKQETQTEAQWRVHLNAILSYQKQYGVTKITAA